MFVLIIFAWAIEFHEISMHSNTYLVDFIVYAHVINACGTYRC